MHFLMIMIQISNLLGQIQVNSSSIPSLILILSLGLYSNGKELSWEELQHARNNYYQQEQVNLHQHPVNIPFVSFSQAKIIAQQTNETFSSITAALNIHLNIGQSMTMNTPSVFLTLETATIQSLSNKFIPQVGNAQIRIPSLINTNINENSSVSLRVSCSRLE